jgi:hypothetical protein
MDKLADWPKLLVQFQKTIKKSGKSIQTSTIEDGNAPIRLLRMIGRNNQSTSFTAIEANFLYAAMHIACMKDIRSPSEICPDIPGDIDGLVRS